MYEQAFRLSFDSTDTSIKTLEKQCKCYIAAINSLNLVKEEDAWIVKPCLNEEMDVMDTGSENVSLESKKFSWHFVIRVILKFFFFPFVVEFEAFKEAS